jgi:hypothetical protein
MRPGSASDTVGPQTEMPCWSLVSPLSLLQLEQERGRSSTMLEREPRMISRVRVSTNDGVSRFLDATVSVLSCVRRRSPGRFVDSRYEGRLARADGESPPAAKAKIQSEVWRSRDAKWIELEGEGKQEAGKR